MQLQDFMPPRGTTITITREMTTAERKRAAQEKVVDIFLDELKTFKTFSKGDVTVRQHGQRYIFSYHPELLIVTSIDLRFGNKHVYSYHHEKIGKVRKSSKEYLMVFNPCTILRAIKMLHKAAHDKDSQRSNKK